MMISRQAVVLAASALLVAVPAFPCGGPGADIVDRPLVPVETYLRTAIYEDEYEVRLRQELRFLEPFRVAMPDSVATVYAVSYERNGYVPEQPDDSVLRRIETESVAAAVAAISRGAYREAAAAARRAVDDVLDTPAINAISYRDALRTAVEIIDMVPHLRAADAAVAARYFASTPSGRDSLGASGALPPPLRDAHTIRALPRDSAAAYSAAHPASPRLGSLRFVALQEAMRTGIPNGWAGSIRDSVPAERWMELERVHDDWLRTFATHPMADYVRFSKVRLFYFKGDSGRAWNELLAMYPRHRQRVLGEMRYLLYVGMEPASLDDARVDWPLRTALLTEMRVTPAQWTTYWRVSEARSSEAWATSLQERLLWQAIRLTRVSGSLPAGFPTRAAAPTPLWGKLRLLALLEAGDVPGAFAQADSVGDDTDVDAIRVRLHLLRRDWRGAIAAARRDAPAVQYLVRVLAPQPLVDSLAGEERDTSDGNARLTVAARRARAGDWRGASRIAATVDPVRARLWSRTAVLAADTTRAGRLAFARWMRDRHGQLFFGEHTDWLRGLNWRRNALTVEATPDGARPMLDPRLGWSATDERARIEDHLRASTELYYSLIAYARWLDGASSRTPGLAAVVREADIVYNRLINWDAGNSPFWGDELESSAEARSIRRAGRLLGRAR